MRSCLSRYAFGPIASLTAVALGACGGEVIDQQTRVDPSSTASAGGSATSTSVVSSGTAGSSQGGGGSGGTNDTSGIISISVDSALEAETHVAVAPPGLVCVAWISESQNGTSTNGYRFSKDGGASWEPVAQLASPDGRVASDPVLAVDAQGNVYMTWIGFRFDSASNAYDMHVYVSVAPAGATTFGAPVEVSAPTGGESYDKPWITITKANAVLVTYARTSSGGLLAGRSVDQGKTWTNAVIVDDGGFRNLAYPCIEPVSGRVFVTYHAGGGIGLRWSDDDGVTFPDVNKTAVASTAEPTPAFDDPTCVANGSDVWVSYGLSTDALSEADMAKLFAIRLAHSSTSGASIDWRVAADDPTAAKYSMHPQLAREDGGALDVVFYAGSDDADAAGTFRHTRSTDGGKTWAPSDVVKTPIEFLQSRSVPQWLGDYVGLAVSGGTLYTSYTDNTLGYSHVAFRAMPLPSP